MVLKLTELADDVMLCRDDGSPICAADLRDEFAEDEETHTDNWWTLKPAIWTPSIQQMFDSYTESQLEGFPEEIVNAVYTKFKGVKERIQALLDEVAFEYYDGDEEVEIDVPVKEDGEDDADSQV